MTQDSRHTSLAARLAVVTEVLADPPVAHYLTFDDLRSGQLTGVHSTDEDCYRFLASHCRPGWRTLETGSGVSTVLFAAWACEHRCITPLQEEVDALMEYCRTHAISTEHLAFDAVRSDLALTRIPESDPALDAVLIDGGHGFPTPMIDWFYGAGRLRRGGILVVDDLQLPAVKVLCSFLNVDNRWRLLHRTSKWAAYERRGEGSLSEDWFDQQFYRMPGSRIRPVGRREAQVRRILRPIRRAWPWS